MSDISYIATLIGIVDNPQAAYLVSVEELSLPITTLMMQQILDNDIKSSKLNENKFVF